MKHFCHICNRKIEKVAFSKQVICTACKLKILEKQKTMPEEIKPEEVTEETDVDAIEDIEIEESV